MFYTIYLILISLCSFIFIFYGIYILSLKKPTSFLWNKPVKNISKNKIKQYNSAVAILYILIGLFFSVASLIYIYWNVRFASICLMIIIIAIIPTFSSIHTLIVSRYMEEK